jgi:hypothetical protein
MKSTIGASRLRVNDLAQTVFGHTLLQEMLAVLARLGTPKSSIHPVSHDNERGTPKQRQIAQTLDNVHFRVNRLFRISRSPRSGPHLIERRCKYFIALEYDSMMQ